MANHTLGVGPFPAGTTVGVYARRTLIPESGPIGAVITTGTTSSTGTTPFTGLTYETDYKAAAQLNGVWRTVLFTTDPDPSYMSATQEDLQALQALVEAEAVDRADAVADEATARANAVTALDGRTDKLESGRLVSVTDYGATGDGSTDDSAAIVAAYNALPAGGGTLFFPAGTYSFGGGTSLIFTKKVTLQGAGRGQTTLKNRNTNGQHFIWIRASGSTVKDMTIDGERGAQAAATGSAVNFAGTGASAPLTPIQDVAIIDCDVYGNGFDCIGIVAVDGFLVQGCHTYDSFDAAVDIVEGSKNGRVAHNMVRTAGRWGIGIDTADEGNYSKCRNITIEANTVVQTTGADVRQAILIQTAENIVVKGNTIDASSGGSGGIRVDQNALRVAVEGNTVWGSSGGATYGIQIEGLTVQEKIATVIGNTVFGFTGSTRAGIQIENATRVVVSGNVVSGCQRGINVEGTLAKPISSLTVSDNQCTGCDHGMRFGAADGANAAVVVDNHVAGNTTYNYVFDVAWTVEYRGAARTNTYLDPACTIRTLVEDNLQHVGTKAGFFNTAPIVKPTGVAVDAAGIHAALVSLGLIAA